MSASPLIRFKLPLSISSWLAFAIALTLYWITSDPGVSYWDCPEYVTSASMLQIGHPPGNPFWMLAMRVATIPFSPEHHARVINLCSGIFMAFAVFFLARVIFMVCRVALLYFHLRVSNSTSDFMASLMAVGGALTFGFCDSVWYSAVEAEVYAMSTFLSVLSLWIMVVWWWERNHGKRFRLIILLSYITGLSLGVHQLNLLLIPVYALVILYRKNPFRISGTKIIFLLGASFGVIVLILMGLIPVLMTGAGNLELFGTNTLSLPYNVGAILFFVLVLSVLIAAAMFLWKYGLTDLSFGKKSHVLKFGNVVVGSLLFLLVGFSVYALIPIRSYASPPLNEGVPDNIFSLSSYLAREQYPSSPLIYGPTPYSQPIFIEEFVDSVPRYSRYLLRKGKPKYMKTLQDPALNHRSGFLSKSDSLRNQGVMESGKGYILTDYNYSQVLTPELDMWFPRLYSRSLSDRQAYEDWAGMKPESMLNIPISETIDSSGDFKSKMSPDGTRRDKGSYKPTMTQNLRFFLSYQAYYMYFRYLFWNFIGRQNDFPSQGEIEHGNFITGVSFIDTYLGVTDRMPSEIWEDNPGRNRYFGIPFLIGIFGIGWLLYRNRWSRRICALISLIFLMTGLAIVVYLNQTPGEPRERDYTFLVSYMAYAMWIASGFLGLTVILAKRISSRMTVAVCCIFALGTPALMAIENFDDHDRRGRFEPAFYATSLLDFELPAVIFSHGDNSSFPLWYASEVLNSGPSHTPVDITYLSLPSYIVNLKKQGNKGLSTTVSTSRIAYGAYLLSRIPPDSVSRPMDIDQILKGLYASDPSNPTFPSSKMMLPTSRGDSLMINLREFTRGSSFMSFRHLMLLDIINSQLNSDNPKVLFFPYAIDLSFYKPLMPLLENALFGKIYAPWLSESQIDSLLGQSAERELNKLQKINIKPHYMDPLIADRSRRYRGELIIAANRLLCDADTAAAIDVIEAILQYYPYGTLLPGSFTQHDSTYYEGKEFRNLLMNISSDQNDRYIGKSTTYREYANYLDSLMNRRHREWLKYYHSLTPGQRATLSNRSRRLLIK